MWDLFISHATEDKDEIARPLAKRLMELGLEVWYDEFSLTLGDSLRESIDKGLSESRFGIVIFSKNFFSKDWPKKELNGIFAREEGAGIILPIWHKIDESDIIKYSPILADRVAVNSSKGLDKVIEEILKVIKPQSDYLSNGKNILKVKKVPSPNKTDIISLEYYLEMAEDYFLELEMKDYSRKTIQLYKSIINEFYEFLIEEKTAYNKKGLLSTFRKYIAHLKRDRNNNQNSIHNKVNIIKKFFKFNGINTLNKFETPKNIKSTPKLLSEQEVKKLINAFDEKSDSYSKNKKNVNLRNKIILTLLYSSGLKASEIVYLRKSNLDLNNKYITFEKNEKKINATFNQETMVLIEEFLKNRYYNSDFLFVSKLGDHLTAEYIRTIAKKHAKEAGIKKNVNPRILRYSFEEHHQKRNMDIQTLKNIYDNAKSI